MNLKIHDLKIKIVTVCSNSSNCLKGNHSTVNKRKLNKKIIILAINKQLFLRIPVTGFSWVKAKIKQRQVIFAMNV